jgi:hypothetical protein
MSPFDTSILANEAKAFDTSVLAEDASQNMNPEEMAFAKSQFEESKPDLTVSRLIHGPWQEVKKAVADTARGQNLPEVFNKQREQEMARLSRDDIGLGTPFKAHEIAAIESDIEEATTQGIDPKTARDTAISKIATARKEDTESLLQAMENHLHPSIPPTDEIHAKMLSRYKKSDTLEAIADSKMLEMDPEFERSSGLIEDVFRGIGQSIVPMAAMLVPFVGPASGSYIMYDQIKGATYQNLVNQGVDPDRANQAGTYSALAQTPMEFLGDMFVLKKILGSGRGWSQYISGIAESMAVEGLTEFAQQYPDDAATMWAMNPNITPQQMWADLMSLKELKEAGYAGLVGALSGGIMTGAGGGANYALQKYVMKSQRQANEENMGTFLGAVKKQMEGGTLSNKEAEMLSTIAENMPQEALNRMYYQTAVETENRDKVYDGLLKSNITKEQADGVVTILDSIAHHYAEQTGNTPESFYDTELVNYQVRPFEEFNQGTEEDRKAAQSRTQYQGSDYAMSHRPNPEGPPAHDLLSTDLAPDDIYDHPDYYTGDPKSKGFKESVSVLKNIRNNPDADITVYRASPVNELNKGDWVSLSKTYSQQHGMADDPSEDIPVHEFKVKAKDIKWAGDTLEEFGYFPETTKFQTANQKTPLGATSFTQYGAIITAFEGNNASTPIHEIGHLLTDLIYRYDPQSYGIITKWLKIEPERAAQGLDAWTTAEHEHMAKAFETYMMEGKAPNFRLLSVFKNFKKWLLDIYRRVTKLGVKINPEIRGVFDQWLTTEEDKAMDFIKDMANWSNVDKIDSIKADDYQSFDDVAAKAQALVASKVKNQRQKDYEATKRELRKEAAETINAMDFYRDLTRIIKNGGFNEKLVRDLWGPGEDQIAYLKKLGIIKKNGKIGPDGYIHAVITDQGRSAYSDFQGFLEMALDMTSRKQAIEDKFNQLLSEFEEEAQYQSETINDVAQIIDQELKILYAILGTSPVRGKIIGREIKQIEELSDPDIQELKKLASDLGRAAKEAFTQGSREERKAQKEKQADQKAQSEEEIASLKQTQKERLASQREKNIQKTIELKEKQKEAIAKLREQYRIRQEKARTMKRLKKYLKKKDMLYDNRQQLHALLARYFKVGKFIPDPEMMNLEDFLAGKFPVELQAGEVINDVVNELPDPRRDAQGQSIKKDRWTLDDIQKVATLADMLVEIDKQERSQQAAVEQARRQELVDHLYTANGKEPSFLPEGEILMRPKDNWFQRTAKGIKTAYSELVKIEFLCNWLDNHEKVGMAWERIFKPLADAENAELVMHDKYYPQLKQIMEPFMVDKTWTTKVYEVAGTNTRLTRQDMFMVAINSGNKQNLAYLVLGNKIPGEVIDQIYNTELTEQERAAVEKIWSLLDTLYPMLNDINKKLLGVPLKKVGDHYFPIKADYKLSDVARRQEEVRTAKDIGFGPLSFTAPAHGFRKTRAEQLKEYPPLLLDVSVLADHLDKTIHDITHSIPVMDVYHTINAPEIRKALKDVAGPEMVDQILPWLHSISRPKTEIPSGIEKLARRLRRNTSIVAMGLKQTVAWLQFTALTHTAQELGVKATAGGVGDFFKNPWQMAEFIKEKSIMMAHRQKAYDREMAMFKSETLAKGGKWDTVQDMFFAQIGMMDMAAAYPTWLAAYKIGTKKYTMQDGSPDEEKIIDFADSTVRRTQGAARSKDLPTAMKGSEMKKLWTMFYTWGNVFENQMMELQQRTGIKSLADPKRMATLVKGLIFLVAIPGYLSMLLYKRRLPENEEWATWLLAYRFSGIPVVREITSPLIGYDFKVPMTEAYNSGSRIINDVLKVSGKLADDEDVKWYNVMKDVGNVAGYWYGLPSAQTFTTLDGLLDLIEEKSDNPLDLLFRKPRGEKETESY